jgi:hypothetical protein
MSNMLLLFVTMFPRLLHYSIDCRTIGDSTGKPCVTAVLYCLTANSFTNTVLVLTFKYVRLFVSGRLIQLIFI